jgi:3-vinyl bacteriochlorophyllide hydratase
MATANRAVQAAPLYTPEERLRRDATVWTTVQGVLAPLQFLVFLVSLALVARWFLTGEGLALATASVVLKTLVLYAIMVTGSIWEKVVFGKWLFAPAFFWEDVVSMGVIALHTLYLAMVLGGWGTPAQQLAVALAAYAIYVVNAAQFLWKLRLARLQGASTIEEADAAEARRWAECAQ